MRAEAAVRTLRHGRVAWYPLEDRRRGFHFRKVHDAVGFLRTRCGIEDHSGRLQVRRPTVPTTCSACLTLRRSDVDA